MGVFPKVFGRGVLVAAEYTCSPGGFCALAVMASILFYDLNM